MAGARKPRKKSIKLHARLDTAEAPRLYESLSRQSHCDLRLDLSEVRWIGAACAEILVNALVSRHSCETKIELSNPSEDFMAGIQLLGLQRFINSDQVERS